MNDNNQAIFYLIAFTDHNIVPVFGFRAELDTNVDLDHALHEVSLDLINRELSQRPNEEREFRPWKP